jgi:hypothetical protein
VFQEIELYHRRDGVVFAERDDLICAIRYAWMMRRFAQTHASATGWNRELSYPKGNVA